MKERVSKAEKIMRTIKDLQESIEKLTKVKKSCGRVSFSNQGNHIAQFGSEYLNGKIVEATIRISEETIEKLEAELSEL